MEVVYSNRQEKSPKEEVQGMVLEMIGKVLAMYLKRLPSKEDYRRVRIEKLDRGFYLSIDRHCVGRIVVQDGLLFEPFSFLRLTQEDVS
jgi:hypothetical protein